MVYRSYSGDLAESPAMPGEFGDLPIYGATHVKVVLLGEGFRARIPLWLAVPSGQAADCG